MASITLSNVVKRYGQGKTALQVIHGVNAEVADGEFIVIVGPSGCGKSTLLRMVAGLEEISGGDISIGGRVVNNLEPAERDIAMVFQNYALYPHMSVFDNMAYGLKIAKVPLAEIKTRVDKAAPGARPGHTMGIRPEHLDLGTEGWPVTVETVELLGAERLIYARLGDEALIIRSEESRPAPAPGQTVHVLPRPDRVHWFDSTTGQRLAA